MQTPESGSWSWSWTQSGPAGRRPSQSRGEIGADTAGQGKLAFTHARTHVQRRRLAGETHETRTKIREGVVLLVRT